MSETSRRASRVGLGLRALKGGAAIVAVTFEDDQPRVLLSTFLATSDEGDRLSREPYLVAREMMREAHGGPSVDAAAAVAEGRARQDRLAAKNLQHIMSEVHEANVVAALLVNRAAWITDLLTYSLEWPEHVPVAEGLAVREALRFACTACCIDVIEVDEKSLLDLAKTALGLSSPEIDARLKDLGATAGRPWRKEQKLACLSAWVTLNDHW